MHPHLIPALLRIQERYGYLPENELVLLAAHSGLPLYRLQEVSTFFPHFRREKPPRLTVHLCQSMSCHRRGAAEMLTAAKSLEQAGVVEIRGVSCLGRCDRAPAALVSRHDKPGHGGHDFLYTAVGQAPERDLKSMVSALLEGRAPQPDNDLSHTPPQFPGWQIDIYRQEDGALEPYAAVRQFLDDTSRGGEPDEASLTAEVALARVQEACLFGMGGAAANTARKWKEVAAATRERGLGAFVVCNGDESEPGTFKDRELLLRAPHLVVEGMLLAGLILHAQKCGSVRGYLYIRHEYHEQIDACRRALENARRIVPEALQRCPLEVFVSPGAYICGEESALLEAIEGKRAQPRNQPPSIRSNGLDDKPTLLNNVETFAWIPAVVLQRSGWWRRRPLRFFSISGDVQRPGVFEIPFAATTLGQLIEAAGGMRAGTKLKAVAPSGPSGGFLPATFRHAKPLKDILTDKAIDGLGTRSPNAVEPIRQFRDRCGDQMEIDIRELLLDKQLFMLLGLDLGAGIVVYGEDASMLDEALNCLEFFEKESCGKCVPCRLGCQQLVHLAHDLRPGASGVSTGDVLAAARNLATAMEVTSICGLGRSAANPLTSALDHFGHEMLNAKEET